jgi:hypothetical protein
MTISQEKLCPVHRSFIAMSGRVAHTKEPMIQSMLLIKLMHLKDTTLVVP